MIKIEKLLTASGFTKKVNSNGSISASIGGNSLGTFSLSDGRIFKVKGKVITHYWGQSDQWAQNNLDRIITGCALLELQNAISTAIAKNSKEL